MLAVKIIYLILIIYGAFFIILYNRYQTLFVYLILCIVPFMMLGILIDLRSKIEISFNRLSANKVSSKTVDFCIEVINHSRFFPLLSGRMDIIMYNEITGEMKKESVMFSVKHQDTESIRLVWNGKYSGTVILFIEKIKIFDYYGMFSLKLCKNLMVSQKGRMNGKKGITLEAMKLPREFPIVNLPESLSADDGVGEEVYAKHHSGDDPVEIFDMHDYREGDKLNRIHWKLSCKRGVYIVKDYSFPVTSDTRVFIDFANGIQEDYDWLEAMFQTIYNLGVAMLDEDIAHDMIWYHKDLKQTVVTNICTMIDLEQFFHELFLHGNFHEPDNVLTNYINQMLDSSSIHGIYILKGKMDQSKFMGLGEVNMDGMQVLCVVNEEKTRETVIQHSEQIMVSMLRAEQLEADFRQWQDRV